MNYYKRCLSSQTREKFYMKEKCEVDTKARSMCHRGRHRALEREVGEALFALFRVFVGGMFRQTGDTWGEMG